MREHSERPHTGILAFQARHEGFEFVAADNGVGVLATLRDAQEFRNLNDHGRALHLALQEGVSRHGRDADHGNGFQVFVGLRSLRADLRFRSGDHALTINGSRPDLDHAELVQKVPFLGFLHLFVAGLPRLRRAEFIDKALNMGTHCLNVSCE